MSDKALTWESCTLTHQGKVRQHNEDSCLERPDLGLWVVADGLGGHLAGDVASQMIVTELGGIESPQESLEAFVQEVRERIQGVNTRLHEVSQRHRQLVGTTVVALLARGERGACLWAGDSRLYRHAGGQLSQVTTDHTRMQRLIQEGLLAPEEANSDHPASYVVTRALGAQPEIELAEAYFELGDNNTCLLCSDGLVRHVGDAEIAGLLPTGEPRAVAQRLLDLTLDRGAADNVTISVVRFGAAASEDRGLGRHATSASSDDTQPLDDKTLPYRQN